MNITVEEKNRLDLFGRVDVYDRAAGKSVTIIKRLDPEAKDALLRSPYGKGIDLSDDEARVTNWDYYGEGRTVDRVDVSVVSGESTDELKDHFHIIVRALRRKEKIFLESYGSEEEFTVAANIYKGKYKLVKFSYDFADKSAAAVWEEAERSTSPCPRITS